MGESKRRLHIPDEADRLPDFIFVRDKAVEEAGDFILAGKLLTDLDRHKRPSESESAELAEVIQRLTCDVQHGDPDLEEAGIWRNGVKPPDGLAPPFPHDLVRARLKRCAVVGVRVDRNALDGFIRLDATLLADVMGRH
jgi:hypothetical protein